MNTAKTLLDHVYDHEAAQPDRVFLTQPLGGGAVVDITWGQALDEARRMAAHLKKAACAPTSRCRAGEEQRAFHPGRAGHLDGRRHHGGHLPTETSQNVRYVLEHCEARWLFVGKLDDWATQQAGVPAAVQRIALPLAPDDGGHDRWNAIVARTAPLPGRPARAPQDLAMILYTSGSTGQPKGVMQTFGAVTAVTQGIVDYGLKLDGNADVEHRALSYLPLAHCFERAWVECPTLLSGRGRLYFTESLATFIDDLKRARPTVFVSVPRLWSKFQQGVFARMPAAQLDTMLDNPAMAPAVGKQVLASLGLDACIRAGTGSAPMPPALQQWYERLGLALYDGYAMTEDFAYSHTSTAEVHAPGRVGRPSPGVQTRLAEDGEILVKSPGQMAGYYKAPELTAESFTADGFFKTGDLGEYDEQGLLKLTGRKKELFKTAKGKYVAPAPIEGRLAAHPMVEIALVAGTGQSAAHALVMLDEGLRARVADAAVRAQVDEQLAQLLVQVNAAVASHEHLQFIVVARDPWTMANGCLTPTMKIKRREIEASVAAAVNGWYEAKLPVVWA